ncbi:MAG: GGDEF domain-containing protein [Thalassotalea sp.]|nr:GGDEF domain-containing protein [Thalassotalea sp.]
MYNEKLDNIFLMALLTLTIATLLLHNFSLNQSLIVDANTPFNVHAVTDKTIHSSGGSEATLTTNEDHFLLNCEITSSEYAWPFCEMTLNFTANKVGDMLPPIDLSKLTNVKVYAQYIGDNSAGIRFQLRSFNPAYSTYNNDATWKYNGIEYKPENNSYPVSFNLDTLQVATWWLLENEIPIDLSAPEFDQVMVLEIATGNGIAPGHYQLKIEKVEFTGKVFSNRQIYTSIIMMWVLAAIAGLFINLKRSKEKLVRSINRTSELKKLNSLLNVETKELKNQVERDPLTGALNRAGIEPIFTSEIKILSLIFIDIDHFKSINDNYGHAIGDEILIEFVSLISKNSRATDFLSRWGGEEFLLICPNTKLNEASELAESLRLILSKHHWVKNIKLTSSFGVAQKGKESVDQFIERADKALYAAKAQGRNTVVTSKGSAIDSSITF